MSRYWTGERVLKRTWPYDMWSLGVTWLELVMGTPHVFQVDPRTRVKLYHQLRMDAMSDVSRHLPSPPSPLARASHRSSQ